MFSGFSTDKIDLASFLMVSGVQLADVVETDPGEFTFIFPDLERSIKLATDFTNGALAPAWELFKVKKYLITRIKNAGGRY